MSKTEAVTFDSSNLANGEWHCVVDAGDTSDVGELKIMFNNGGIYVYHEVPEFVWYGLKTAESPGAYFHANIRNNYNNERIN